MLYVTTKNTLYSSHILKNHKGKCGTLHGHQYEILLTLKGGEDDLDECNFLMDFYDFDNEWKRLFPTDHVNLNEITNEDNPSVEYLSKWIYDQLKPTITQLHSVEIYETPTNSCKYMEE